EDPSVLLRIKEDHDGAEPSGNSVAAINLIRLSSIISGARSEDYRRTAEHLLVIQIDGSSREEMEFWENCNPNVAQMAKGTVEDKKAVAYVCQDFVCSPPVTEPDALRALLGKAVAVASST
ncbi:hypothetical protein B296_00032242, partial [Ensete ventricosum]